MANSKPQIQEGFIPLGHYVRSGFGADHKKRHTHKNALTGFTLLEIIIVIGVIVLIALLAVSAFSQFNEESALDRANQAVRSALLDARSRTIASEADAQYGVHFETGRVVRFTGASYSAGAAENKETVLPARTEISDISLADGGSDVVFSKQNGEASTSGTVTVALTSGTAPETVTITIAESGLVEASE